MNAKQRSKAWAIDQLDPDNWLRISDFGVRPEDVLFKGFSGAIVVPQSIDLRHRHENIRSLVKLVRSKIRKQFNSLAETPSVGCHFSARWKSF